MHPNWQIPQGDKILQPAVPRPLMRTLGFDVTRRVKGAQSQPRTYQPKCDQSQRQRSPLVVAGWEDRRTKMERMHLCRQPEGDLGYPRRGLGMEVEKGQQGKYDIKGGLESGRQCRVTGILPLFNGNGAETAKRAEETCSGQPHWLRILASSAKEHACRCYLGTGGGQDRERNWAVRPDISQTDVDAKNNPLGGHREGLGVLAFANHNRQGFARSALRSAEVKWVQEKKNPPKRPRVARAHVYAWRACATEPYLQPLHQPTYSDSGRVFKFGWTSTSINLFVFTVVFKLYAFADDFGKQSAKNVELKCEQDHEYFLKRLPSATWNSSELFPFAEVSELFLLLSPGSSRESSCEFLQPLLTCPSTIHGETGMNQNISWMNTILPRFLRVRFSQSFDFRSQQDFNMTFLSQFCQKKLSCLSVKIHLHCFGRRHQETQWLSTVLWVARSEVSLAATWVVSPPCTELSHHQLLEKLPLKHIWKTCNNTGTVSCFVTLLSVPEGSCTWHALWEYSGDRLVFSFRLGSPPILQSPFLDWPQWLVLIEDLSCNEFFVLWKHIITVFWTNLEILFKSV